MRTEAQKEYHKLYYREWRKRNPEKTRLASKKYLANGGKEKQKIYDHSEAKLAKRRIIQSTPEWKAYMKAYRRTEKFKEWARENARKRRLNPFNRLNDSMTTRIREALRGIKNHRKWCIFVGYSLEELKIHLESLFQEGMTWDNYGKWHIDHIKPRSSFRFKSAEDVEFKECWALSNLQPLWAKDNLSKGCKY